ncbi:pyridoxal phosphate-dependent transferase [Elsinoe ampelina]|uniref:Pyridoxal phosphate-dependent transferase n=1 Tax=Elsinoe ampelina TaxID=302913 RepID=A0A6A6G0N2_9PEZI|nr:pyridoxal phosphate-dependent transferase [Elsinoe ampelina]
MRQEVVDLSIAENWLVRDLLVETYRHAIQDDFTSSSLSYPPDANGLPSLLNSLAEFFNKYFRPHREITTKDIAVGPGATSCLEALLLQICEPGDGVLIPAPYWNGFDFWSDLRAKVTPLPVYTSTVDDCNCVDLVSQLEKALGEATCPVKALIITNPNNPITRCYSRTVLEELVRFCERHKLQLISDEIYALTMFPSSTLQRDEGFVSILELCPEDVGFDLSRVSVLWGSSKALGSSGIRVGCVVIPENLNLRQTIATASALQVSSMSAVALGHLLECASFDAILQTNQARLVASYRILTGYLAAKDIRYLPTTGGLFVMARIAPSAQSWEEESLAIETMLRFGVKVSPGRAYHMPEDEKGWARISFAVPTHTLLQAITRIEAMYNTQPLS